MYRLRLVVLLKHQNFDVALELSREFGGECNLNVWSSYTQCRYSETVCFNIPHFRWLCGLSGEISSCRVKITTHYMFIRTY